MAGVMTLKNSVKTSALLCSFVCLFVLSFVCVRVLENKGWGRE